MGYAASGQRQRQNDSHIFASICRPRTPNAFQRFLNHSPRRGLYSAHASGLLDVDARLFSIRLRLPPDRPSTRLTKVNDMREKARRRKPTQPASSDMVTYRLVDIYLQQAEVQRSPAIKDVTKQPLNIQLGVGIGHDDKEPTTLILQVAAHVETKSKDLRIHGNFVLIYEFESPLTTEQVNGNHLTGFARNQGVLHAWPYLREFVQSATTRMGLPALKLPLIVPSSVKFEAADPPAQTAK